MLSGITALRAGWEVWRSWDFLSCGNGKWKMTITLFGIRSSTWHRRLQPHSAAHFQFTHSGECQWEQLPWSAQILEFTKNCGCTQRWQPQQRQLHRLRGSEGSSSTLGCPFPWVFTQTWRGWETELLPNYHNRGLGNSGKNPPGVHFKVCEGPRKEEN